MPIAHCPMTLTNSGHEPSRIYMQIIWNANGFDKLRGKSHLVSTCKYIHIYIHIYIYNYLTSSRQFK